MRLAIPRWLDVSARVTDGPYASAPGDGPTGAFLTVCPVTKAKLKIIASDGTVGEPEELGWEHVSVSVAFQQRTPKWSEMCFVKDLFWGEEETVLQFHPPKSEYVNCHPFCLHMWRKIGFEQPRPPAILVGPKS